MSAVVEDLTLVSNERLAEGVGLARFDCELIPARVDPGQFVHLRIAKRAEFILRRPFSVHRAGDGWFEILYQVVGKGTRALSMAEPGAVMDAVGPLGHGWEVPGGAAHALVVAGGLGVAPMGMLLERLAEAGVAATVALGAPTAERVLRLDLASALARRVEVATDDGSLGHAGVVTDVTDELLAGGTFDVVYACGPEPMCEKVAEQALAAGASCQVSLERLMACGVGVCLSCVVETRSGLARACAEGPVFDAAEVVWGGSGSAGADSLDESGSTEGGGAGR
ncbi:MAG: dihydroorotate dehydrogenase electron transfer subunit [Coriobacteriia bacterium]